MKIESIIVGFVLMGHTNTFQFTLLKCGRGGKMGVRGSSILILLIEVRQWITQDRKENSPRTLPSSISVTNLENREIT